MERVAFLVDETGERIDCLLNPETFEVKRLAGVRPRATAGGQLVGSGLADDPLQFTGGGRTELVLDLIFDVELVESTRQPSDVRALTRRLWELSENSSQEHGAGRPPLVRLVWGKTWNVPGVIVAVAERFDAIAATGVPRRSWLRLKLVRVAEPAGAPPASFEDALVSAPGTAPVPATGSAEAVQAVGDGQAGSGFSGVRVDLLAAEVLGDPLDWRRLADHNDLANPLEVAPGAVLSVPGREDRS
jgi:CelD/BcsL family acetyltransferase involved in cellulose biosynthesis